MKVFVWLLSRRIVRMESAGKWAVIFRKKPSRDWLEKDQWESVVSAQSLSCPWILFVGRGRGWKFWWKFLQKQIGGKESGFRLEQRIYCHHNIEHRRDFVKGEVQWLDFSSVFWHSSVFTSVPLPKSIQKWTDAFYSSNTLLHLFLGKFVLKLWRWLFLLYSIASMTLWISRSTGSPWDHPLNQPLPIFLLATMNLSFSRPLSSRWCITAIWMILS